MKFLVHSRRLLAFGGLLVMLLAAALPALAAQGGSFVSYTLDEANCTVDVSAQVEDAGFYAINMWDDGNYRAGAGSIVEAGGTLTIRFTIGGVILQGAAGIGVYLEELASPAATITYDADGSAQLWSDAVGLHCQSLGFVYGASVATVVLDSCPHPLPPGSFVYNVPDGALAFYAADPNTYTGFNLPPGTWYISEFGEAYAKVWIACGAQPIYIPVGNVVR